MMGLSERFHKAIKHNVDWKAKLYTVHAKCQGKARRYLGTWNATRRALGSLIAPDRAVDVSRCFGALYCRNS
jgi:hypothetical protein